MESYLKIKRSKCENLLESYSSISPELLDNFEDRNGPLFFQFAMSNFEVCWQVPNEINKLYMSKIFNPQLDIFNDTVLLKICPGCTQESGKHVREWFKSSLNISEIIQGNCSSIGLDGSSSVAQWCNKCWIEKDDKCNKCFQQSKAALIDICTMEKYPPTGWKYYDIFMSKFLRSELSPENGSQQLRQLVKGAAKKNHLNILSLWRFLNMPLLADSFERYWPETDLAKEEMDVKDALSKLSENEQNEIYQTLQSPKIHGNPLEDYVLVPFCSFGSKVLKKCDLFEQQKNLFRKDEVCYTFNKKGNYSGKSLDKLLGLNFVVNLRLPGYPGDPKDSLDLTKPHVIVHTHNELPDMRNFPAASHEINAVDPFKTPKIGPLVIGVKASITNGTASFARMPEPKRKCYLNAGNRAHYSRNNCQMQEALKLAKSNCGCAPWFLKINASVCDPIGLSCFENFTENYLRSTVDENCLDECFSTDYELTFGEILALSNLGTSFGEDWKIFFDDYNPMYYTPLNGRGYGMVHVNFIHKKSTVTMKDSKVNFADMLGSIGGTLGVFIGLSFVGLLDFFIWVWDWVKEKWSVRTRHVK